MNEWRKEENGKTDDGQKKEKEKKKEKGMNEQKLSMSFS